jgi:hypothetical protein
MESLIFIHLARFARGRSDAILRLRQSYVIVCIMVVDVY